jgi:hypothetical protein
MASLTNIVGFLDHELTCRRSDTGAKTPSLSEDLVSILRTSRRELA